jgi:hypothetical protein
MTTESAETPLFVADTGTAPRALEYRSLPMRRRRIWAALRDPMVWARFGIILVVLAVCKIAGEQGLELRRNVWAYTGGEWDGTGRSVHFEGDVSNGFNWGMRASQWDPENGRRGPGLFELYESLSNHTTFGGPAAYALDYPPLRLSMVTMWAQWARRELPQYTSWHDEYPLTAPMLWMNTVSEAVSSILVFIIVLMLVRRMHAAKFAISPAPARRLTWPVIGFVVAELLALAMSHWEVATQIQEQLVIHWWLAPFMLGAVFLGSGIVGLAPALFGAFSFWFNPAIIWDGHCWPQWDVWLVPFFLAAVALACVDWWFPAGVLIMIGACLKGQMLLGAPILLLWPLCQLRFGAVLRLVAGIALGMAAIALPFMKATQPSIIDTGLAMLGSALLIPFVLRWRIGFLWKIPMVLIAAGLAWPMHASASMGVRLLPLSVLGLIALSRFIPAPKLIPHIYALAAGLMVFLLIPVHHASSAWYEIGFASASEKYHEMITGRGTFNLPAVMRGFMRWPQETDDLTNVPLLDHPVPFRTSMVIIYAICLALLGTGAAIHFRRRDTRFLVAMVAPWVISYCLMTQMHGRYLVWGAAMSCLLAGAGWGMALLGLAVSCMAWFGMTYNQYYFDTGWDREHYAMLQQLVPNLGWLLLLAAVILLYVGSVPRTRATQL